MVQIDVIESMTGAMDPTANFTLVILQTELERVKFLLRSFLRARLAKVGAFARSFRPILGWDFEKTDLRLD